MSEWSVALLREDPLLRRRHLRRLLLLEAEHRGRRTRTTAANTKVQSFKTRRELDGSGGIGP